MIELEKSEQKISSAETSINADKIPAVFKMVTFKPYSINLDFGGGKFDTAINYMEETYKAMNVIYDCFNRSEEYNTGTLKILSCINGADSCTLSNVLNVIAEKHERMKVLRNCKKLMKQAAPIYITVYEGDRTGKGRETVKGYQLNKKLKEYLKEIQEVFPNAKKTAKYIVAFND